MEINNPQVLAEVEAVFARYEAALVGNDVAVLDELFWGSPHTIRYGPGESLYGQDEIFAFRKSRQSRGLERALRRTVITTFGTDMATANTEFVRDNSAKIGQQSQTWARMPDGWRVVSAHVSLRDRVDDDVA